MINKIVKNGIVRKWIKDNGCDCWVAFDFKNKDIVLYDGGFVSIKKKVKIHRKRRKSQFGKDVKIDKLACTFYFGSLDETIDYLKRTRTLLNQLGYSTNETIESLDISKLETKDL